MVVEDAYRRVHLRGYRSVVVDAWTGLLQIAQDVQRGVMELRGVSTLLLLLGRADLRNKADTSVVMRRVSEAITNSGFTGKVIITGGLPTARDGVPFCRNLRQQHLDIMKSTKKERYIHYCDAGLVMWDEHGVIPQLVDGQGLTLDGIRKLSLRLASV